MLHSGENVFVWAKALLFTLWEIPEGKTHRPSPSSGESVRSELETNIHAKCEKRSLMHSSSIKYSKHNNLSFICLNDLCTF